MAEKMKMLSFRIDEATEEKIQTLVESSGLKKSYVVRELLLKNTQNVILKDGTKIAAELQKISQFLQEGACSEEMERRINKVCDFLYDEIFRIFKEGDSEDGNLEDD